MSNRQNFEDFWSVLFESDWQIAFKAFIFGNLFFMLSLIQGSWVLYNDHEYGNVAASIVTVICVCCIAFWYLRVYTKWAHYLQKVTIKQQENEVIRSVSRTLLLHFVHNNYMCILFLLLLVAMVISSNGRSNSAGHEG
jgi:hypothetical protein